MKNESRNPLNDTSDNVSVRMKKNVHRFWHVTGKSHWYGRGHLGHSSRIQQNPERHVETAQGITCNVMYVCNR